MSTTKLFYEHELSRFIEARRVGSGADGSLATMTSMGDIKGKWKITDEDYPKFLTLLHDYLFIRHGRCMNFVEQPKKNEPKPLLIDLDFRYPADTSLTRAFGFNHMESFVHLIIKGLGTFFDLSPYSEMRFFVTLRPSPYTEKGKRKDGIHILCPDVALTNEKQSVLRKWILAQEGIKTCFKDTGYTNNDDDVYDESMTRKQGWIFYGESKPNIAPYQLDSVFSYNPVEDDWIDIDTVNYSSRDLMELLSVRYNIVEDINELKSTAAKEEFAALLAADAPLPEQQEAAAPSVEQNMIIDAINYLYSAKTVSEQEFHMIRRFVLECLKDAWFEQYDKWIRVGWCLHNIAATEEMFNLWMEFSEKSGKSSGNNVPQLRQEWFRGMRKSGDGPRLTERSLRKWAREDNPEMYKRIIGENIHEYILGEVEPTHYHIAKLMKKLYGNNYIASVNPRTTEWYKYDDEINMWKRLNQGIELKTKISMDVATSLMDARKKISKDAAEPSIKPDRKQWLDIKLKDLVKVETQLYNNGFTESVMKMAAQQFCEEDFMNKLNVEPFLFGCRNGVLELRAKGPEREHVIFRAGRPEDYVSFLAGRNYPDSEAINYVPYDPSDPRQGELAEFFKKLFPRADLRSYTLRLLASCLEGANREQCYYTLTGGGGNGKSKLIELMRLTFGDYQTSMASTVLTRKRPEAGAANPEIIVTKCRRFIYMQEPDDKEPINTSIMKQFSGEDMIEARALYGDQEKFRIMGKIFMMCNNLPPVTSMDEGTWRRIRVVPFESKFLPPDHPELLLNKPNVFPRDPKLDEKLRLWREPFLSLLVHIYENEYIPNGLTPIPASVEKASNKYKESFDVFARFEADRIREPVSAEEQLECRTQPIDSSLIIRVFNQWKKEAQVRSMTAEQVIERLALKYGEPEKKKYWSSFKIFKTDEDTIDWDKEHDSAN